MHMKEQKIQSEKDNLRDAVSNMEAALQQEKKVVAKQQSSINEQTATLAELERELEEAVEAKADMTKQLADSHRKTRSLETAVEAEQEAVGCLEERLRDLKQNAARGKAQQQEEVDRLEREYAELQEQAQKLKKRAADAEEETENALSTLQAVNAKVRLLEDRLQALPELEKTAELHIKLADLNMRKKQIDREKEAREKIGEIRAEQCYQVIEKYL